MDTYYTKQNSIVLSTPKKYINSFNIVSMDGQRTLCFQSVNVNHLTVLLDIEARYKNDYKHKQSGFYFKVIEDLSYLKFL